MTASEFDFEIEELCATASEPSAPEGFALGDHVYLKGCRHGQPGRVVRLGRRITVHWPDLDFLSKHSPESLVKADGEKG